MTELLRIISGGQTGADQGALEAAKELGIATGGWMPRGFLTETGFRPEFAVQFGMREHPQAEYARRTEGNVVFADGTIIFGDVTSAGNLSTKELCAKHDKSCHVLPWQSGQPVPLESIRDFLRWLAEYRVTVLNVAGNRESEQPGIHEAVRAFLIAALGDF